jgi:preprotein translocase subunit SecD
MLLVLVCLFFPGFRLAAAVDVLRSAVWGDVLQATLRLRPLEGDAAIGQSDVARVREVLVDTFDQLGAPAYVDVPDASASVLVLQLLVRQNANDRIRNFVGSLSRTFSLQEVLAGPNASPAFTQENGDASEVIASADRRYYLLNRQRIAQGRDIEAVENTPEGVVVYFNQIAANRISGYTAGHIGTRLAIVVDRVAVSAPTISEPFGANAMIGDSGDLSARFELALALRAARLGVRLDAEAFSTGDRRRWVIEYGVRAAIALLLAVLLIAGAHRIGRPRTA